MTSEASAPLPKKAAKQADRFVHGELFGELRILQLNAEPLAKLRRVRTPAQAEHFHFSRIRRRQAFADFDGGRLSRAIRPEQAEALARLHFEVEAIDRDHVLVRLSQMADAQGRFGCDFRHGGQYRVTGPRHSRLDSRSLKLRRHSWLCAFAECWKNHTAESAGATKASGLTR